MLNNVIEADHQLASLQDDLRHQQDSGTSARGQAHADAQDPEADRGAATQAARVGEHRHRGAGQRGCAAARRRAQLAARAKLAKQVPGPAVGTPRGGKPRRRSGNVPGAQSRRGRGGRVRPPAARRPVRLRRRRSPHVGLLGAHDDRVGPRRREHGPQRARPVRDVPQSSARPTRTGRSRVLRQADPPRRDLRRGRNDDRGAAHRGVRSLREHLPRRPRTPRGATGTVPVALSPPP